MKLIDADELELDTEWSDYDDGFVSYSQRQIDDAEEVKAISLDRIKEARQEMTAIIEHCLLSGTSIKACGLREARDIIDKLIAEVEE